MTSQADVWMNRLTLKQKLGQMICVRGVKYEASIREALPEGTIGCAAMNIFVHQSRKLDDILQFFNHYFRVSPVPILFHCDPELGLALTFDFGTPFPDMMALGATFSSELAYKVGNVIGKEAKAIGMGTVGCPVLDINTNPDNPIVNTRAFGDRPELVIDLGEAFVRGIQDAGVIALGKHFPGHGDTGEDSHVEMPQVAHEPEHLRQIEFKPFAELIRKGMMGVMSAHILYPSMVGEGEEGLPATLSAAIMTGLLRDEMGFQGLLVSDSLTMKSVKDRYGIGKAAVMAVKAGNDIILQDYESDPEITFRALEEAIQSGELSMEQIDKTVRRILTVKEKFGLLKNPQLDSETVKRIMGCDEHAAVSKAVAERSITCLEAKHLPIRGAQGKKVLLVAPRREGSGGFVEDSAAHAGSQTHFLYNQCRQYSSHTVLHEITESPTAEEIELIARMAAKEFDYVLYAAYTKLIAYNSGNGTLPEAQLQLVRRLQKDAPRFVFLLFGSPYVLNK